VTKKFAYSPSARKRIEVESLEVETVATGRGPRAKSRSKVKPGDRHIGCPVSWMLRVLPAVRGQKQTIVALWLWRRRVICGNRSTFSAPNGELKSWGISPDTKHQTLKLLERAGVIAIKRRGKEALTVTILPEKLRSKRR
jgi:hypothetical protein